MSLTLAVRTRLTKLMGMTGSVHDAEALTALRLAQKLLQEAKINWQEALHGNGLLTYQEGFQEGRTAGYGEGYAKGYREGQRAPRARPASWQAIVREMLDEHSGELSDWERGFLDSFRARGWHTPSDRQRAVLERMADKLGLDLPAYADR